MICNIIFCIITIIISISDIKHKKIPNSLIVTGLIFSLLCSNNLLSSFLGVVMIVLPLIFFYKPNSIGGGDIKMLTIMCFYLGYAKTLSAFVIGIILCFIYATIESKRSVSLAPFFSIGTISTLILTGVII